MQALATVTTLFLLALGGASPVHAQKTIYLTFDMDMSGAMYQKALSEDVQWYSPALFFYLEQQNISATFFISGLFAVAYPDFVHSLASSSSFAFENHGYDESSFTPHCYSLATLTTNQEKTSQVEETEAIIQQTTGQTATYFRFPGICTNAQNNALVKSLGYTINDGTVIAGDPFNANTQAIVNAVLKNATSSAVVLMHVGGPNAPKSLAALKQIVPTLRAEGYQFGKL